MNRRICFLIAIILSVTSQAQYNPSLHSVMNKPMGMAQAIPTDARSYFYDATKFVYRPYQSTGEALAYLNLSKYRVGNFPIYVNEGGTLNTSGTFTGGTVKEYWFKDGVSNSNLVVKSENTTGTIAELRAMYTTTGKVYFSTDNVGGTWVDKGLNDGVYTDDGAMHIITANGHNLEREVTGNEYDIRWWGAVGDWNGTTGTDNYTAITAAISAIRNFANGNAKPTLIFPFCNGYYSSQKITVPEGVNVIMDGPLISGVNQTTAGMEIGSVTVGTLNGDYKIWVTKKTFSDWSDGNMNPAVGNTNIGVILNNLSDCNIYIKEVDKFTIGVDFRGNTLGFTYNTIHLGYITHCKFGVRCYSTGGSGYFNENYLYNGHFQSGVNSGQSRYAVWITSDYGYSANNNHFFKPSVENSLFSPGESIPFLIDYGASNTVYGIRDEGNSPYVARIKNVSVDNKFLNGFSGMVIDDQSLAKTNFTQGGALGGKAFWGQPIFNSGPLHKKAVQYNATNVHVPGLNMAGNEGSEVLKYYSTFYIKENYLLKTGASGSAWIGVFVNCGGNQRFVVRRDADNGYGGRLAIACYDGNGNIMTTAGLVRSENAGVAFSFDATTLGGSYNPGADTNEDEYFIVDPTVKKIRIMIGGGNEVRLRSIQVFALPQRGVSTGATAYTGYNENQKGGVAGAAPSAGTYEQGQIIYNDAPTGTNFGWIAKTQGTFGTLSGVTGTTDLSTKILVVNNANGIAIGNYISIAGVSGIKKVIAIAGNNITLDSFQDAAVTNATVQFVAPVFGDLPIATAGSSAITGTTLDISDRWRLNGAADGSNTYGMMLNAGSPIYLFGSEGAAFATNQGDIIHWVYGNHNFSVATNSVKRFTIDGSGAASFSSTLNATGNITTIDGTDSFHVPTIRQLYRNLSDYTKKTDLSDSLSARYNASTFYVTNAKGTGDTILNTQTTSTAKFKRIISAGDLSASSNDTALTLTTGAIKVLPNANYTVTTSDKVLILTEVGTNRTLTLPAASTMANKEINLSVRATTTGRWTLSGSFVQKTTTGTDPIAENFINSGLVNGVNYRLVSDGVKWYDINN